MSARNRATDGNETIMKWLEICVYTTDAGLDAVTFAFSNAGLDQVSIEESHERAMAFLNERAVYWDFADAEKVGVDEPCVKAYVADVPESEPVVAEVKRAIAQLRETDLGFDAGSLSVVVNRMDDADWENNWKAYYKPLTIGKRLFVLPCWMKDAAPEGRVTLKLDPGVAFGTGEHHTTRMCLELLETVVKPGDDILDLGCGSGILSVAAVLLGAKHAVAVDIDPVAEHVALENAAMNGVDAGKYDVRIGDLLEDETLRGGIRRGYDVVVANIVAGVIISISPFAKTCCKPGAPYIVSGIIDEREDEVKAALVKTGFTVEQVLRSEGWVAMLLRA
ncbi:Ribosomal protein L11 methyltransferase [bioreactor metagenome]|uniref:Ribosomal protein L11 methyltransferase n=1 Tax=bioreactor metagenome TaxID=1076179 RepID=A0A644ZML7_9ZZZZ